MYQYRWLDTRKIDLPLGKVVCVGRNYLDHIKELNNTIPEQPLLFMKGNNALADMTLPVAIPERGECHNELEIALLIGEQLNAASRDVSNAVLGVGLALDLTLRDVQSELKAKGYPWERAKAFDASCPVSPFVPFNDIDDVSELCFSLTVNGEIRQQGDAKMMMLSWQRLLQEIASVFTLYPGDLVLTGTPKGVGKIQTGDSLVAEMSEHLTITSRVA